MDTSLQPNTQPRLKASGTVLALGTSLLSNSAQHNSQELDLETAPATSVMEACPMSITGGLIQIAPQCVVDLRSFLQVSSPTETLHLAVHAAGAGERGAV